MNRSSGRSHYGIAVFHHIGDVLCCTPIAKQLKIDDPECEITWFTSHAGEVAVRLNPDIDHLIVLDGDQYALDREIPRLRESRQWTRFFTPAAYLNYDAIPGGSIANPRGTIFGIVKAAADLSWTVPYVFPFRLAPEEQEEARTFWRDLPPGLKILIETDYRSEQSPWTDEWTDDMERRFAHLDPVYVFTSRDEPPFYQAFLARHPKSRWCNLPFRLNAELFNLSDAFIGVSSGISCLTYSDYCRTDLPRIEVTRGEHWGAAELGHHSRLFLCYHRRRFQEALDHLAHILEHTEVVPDLSPRRSETIFDGRACPNCDSQVLVGLHHLPMRICAMCRSVFRIGTVTQSTAPVTLALYGSMITECGPDDLTERDVDRYERIDLAGPVETLTDPHTVFDRIHAALKPGGRVTVSAANIESLLASRAGPNWNLFNEQSFRWYYSPRTLKEIAIQSGFVIDSCETVTRHSTRELLFGTIRQMQPGANDETARYLAEEFNRRGGGDIIRITASKRGPYQGRVRPAISAARQSGAHRFVEPTAEPTIDTLKRHAPASPRPDVSVVVPCFGRVAFLAETLASIARQRTPCEVIVVDDGNSPSDRTVLETIIRSAPIRVELINTPRVGPAEARDLGIASASGTWIVTLDADDRLGEEFLVQALFAAETHGAQLVSSAARQFGLGERILDYSTLDREWILAGRPCPGTLLFARKLWSIMGGLHIGIPFGTSLHRLWLSAVEYGAQWHIIESPLVEIRVEESGQLHEELARHFRVMWAMMQYAHRSLFRSATGIDPEHSARRIISQPDKTVMNRLKVERERFPRLSWPHLWYGLQCEGNGLLSEAQSAYDTFARLDEHRAQLSHINGSPKSAERSGIISGMNPNHGGSAAEEASHRRTEEGLWEQRDMS